MSAVDETIVREFFESRGFFICQRRKYVVQARQKTTQEEIDLLVTNPRAVAVDTPLEFEITSGELKHVARAVVAVKGWHTELFAPSVLKHQPRIFGFVDKKAVEEARRLTGGEDVVKILVVPGLPRNAKLRFQSIEVLRAKGVDGVISFRSILEELIAGVATNRNYQKSDLLQILRLLKNYDLLKGPQMELKFSRRRAKKAAKP